MKKQAFITWGILVALTGVVALISKLDSQYVVVLILGISFIKFIGIAFQFMELKGAHKIWKRLLIGYSLLVIGIITVLLK